MASLRRSRTCSLRPPVRYPRKRRAPIARAAPRRRSCIDVWRHCRHQLLQENGYLVLRYLAEDLAKELDSVLDGILRSLSSRRAAVVSTHTLNIVRGSRP